jgi:hypothetical protein
VEPHSGKSWRSPAVLATLAIPTVHGSLLAITVPDCIAALATFFPVGLPSLAGEIAWAAGNHYPVAVDWKAARGIARTIRHADMSDTLIADYSPTLCPGIAVYADSSCEKGGWVEVQPRPDPADYISAHQKTYILPLAPGDAVLKSLEARVWLTVYRSNVASPGSAPTSVVILRHGAMTAEVAPLESAVIMADAQWLGRNAIGNTVSYADLLRMSSASGRDRSATRWKFSGRTQAVLSSRVWFMPPVWNPMTLMRRW